MFTSLLRNTLVISAICFFVFFLVEKSSAFMQQNDGPAHIQLIHNAPDPQVSEIELWVNCDDGTGATIDELEFRNATDFFEIPSGNVELAVAQAGAGYDEAMYRDFNFSEGGYYTVIVSGVLNPSEFSANPDDKNIELEIFTREFVTSNPSEDEFTFYIAHGGTDAPALDIHIDHSSGIVIENLAYSEFSEDMEIETGEYELSFAQAGHDEEMYRFQQDFTGLAGETTTLLISGFADPSSNGSDLNDAELTLLIVQEDGTVNTTQEVTSSDNDIASETPKQFDLKNNYPNPFNPTTVIEYQIPEAAHVYMAVFDLLGRERAILVDQMQQSGSYTVTFDGTGLSTGTYIYRISAGDFSDSGKMTLVK